MDENPAGEIGLAEPTAGGLAGGFVVELSPRQRATEARSRVCLFFAVPEEARPFIRQWSASGGSLLSSLKSPPGLAGWHSETVSVHVSGMGRRNARRVAERVFTDERPSVVVTGGFAGGLNPSFRNGDVVFAADEHFPWRNGLENAKARVARFHEATRVVVTPAAKATLRSETQADAVEMESGTIRALCRDRHIPAATIRVISDAADDTLPLDFGALMNPDERMDFVKLVWTLVRSPQKIPQLLRFQRQISYAANELARVLVAVLPRS